MWASLSEVSVECMLLYEDKILASREREMDGELDGMNSGNLLRSRSDIKRGISAGRSSGFGNFGALGVLGSVEYAFYGFMVRSSFGCCIYRH